MPIIPAPSIDTSGSTSIQIEPTTFTSQHLNPAQAWNEYVWSNQPPLPTRRERQKREALRKKAIGRLRHK